MAKNTKDLKEKNDGDLRKLVVEKREELRSLRFSAAGARPKDSNAPKKARKEVARALTELAARRKVAK